MASVKKHEPPTLDEATPPRLPVVAEEGAPTRNVQPHKDHSVENPRSPSSSASLMAVKLPPVATGEDRVRGTLAVAGFEGGDFVLRLAGATAGTRALAEIFAAHGLEVEIVVRRRM